jgi:hypothetical protein
MRGGLTSRLTAPATIQLSETGKSAHSLPGDSETSRAEADTLKVPRAKVAGQVASFTLEMTRPYNNHGIGANASIASFD